ncbi:glycosyltransferase family 2 protein [Fodinibius sp.]|uniref:glycosyltransferase n=1 Tax=Fodinibius sp. TaxID=1872440 RepID=UPI002ACEB624|nr:glycosyltransferase family 2 protein [Fodinibius sp.]MDZ7660636.1 glycosyltransferase family 2 protein [Fodinibius sp.]
MTILLYIALGYLLITGSILYLNKKDFTPLPPTPRNYFDEQAPSVTICIPARNEANSIERCVRSAIDQHYPNHHVLVLDDGSTDGTSEILDSLSERYTDTLTVISGQPKPDDWLGKSWACHQLSEQALSDILIFIDADTWLEPEATSKVVRTMGSDVVDFITLWPRQKFGSFWEKTVIPLVYFALLTLLPTRYVYRSPKWLPSFLQCKIGPLFAAANGQFMAFKKNTYEAIGGHQSVKNEVVEDVELAKNIRRGGFRMKMYHGRNAVSCRMYESREELWQGFRKNFFAGFGHNPFLFIGMGLLHIITFIIPILSLPFLFLWGSTKLILLALAAVVLMFLQRFTVDLWFGWKLRYGFLHPLGVVWYQLLGIQVLSDYFNGVSAQWKDRNI